MVGKNFCGCLLESVETVWSCVLLLDEDRAILSMQIWHVDVYLIFYALFFASLYKYLIIA